MANVVSLLLYFSFLLYISFLFYSVSHRVTVKCADLKDVSAAGLGARKIDLLVAEPYFYSTLLPWHGYYLEWRDGGKI